MCERSHEIVPFRRKVVFRNHVDRNIHEEEDSSDRGSGANSNTLMVPIGSSIVRLAGFFFFGYTLPHFNNRMRVVPYSRIFFAVLELQ